MLSAKTKLCLVIGDPIDHSLSPAMHNAGYKALGIEDQYVFLGANVNIENIEDAVKGFRSLGIRGISCTMPHKLAIMHYLDELDPTAKKIGAVNTVVNEEGKLIGYNTDWLGVITPLEELTSLQNKKVAVLGAGGAARAIIYGLQHKGAKTTIFNRTLDKAEALANEFGVKALALPSFLRTRATPQSGKYPRGESSSVFAADNPFQDVDIIINATSVGMHPHELETPLPKEHITDKHIVYDIIYHPLETRLLKEAKEQGAKTIPGVNMLLYQGTAQFELYTGKKAPVKEMRKVLMK